mgnify:CR=1 FL=1
MSNWKGLILAGGTGSRLHPITKITNKHLLPVYDKPMIYYPLSVLMLAGIRDVEIIINPGDEKSFKGILKNGEALGMNISYKVQSEPKGLADAFIVSKDFIRGSNCCLILGDNFFFGNGLGNLLSSQLNKNNGATIFGYPVINPKQFGIIEFDSNNNVLSIEEKPEDPKSNFVAVGLYFYDSHVVNIAPNIKPSKRGEIEITSINQFYLSEKKLRVERLGRGYAWFDLGTHDDFIRASNFIYTIEKSQKFKVSCLEEIAFRNKWISRKELKNLILSMAENEYQSYLKYISSN